MPRRLRGHFFALLVLAAIAFFFRHNYFSTTSTSEDLLVFLNGLPQPEGGTKPPRFYEWHDREKSLPQHDLNLPYPQGREGRYIRFTNQVCCALSCFFFFLRSSCANVNHEADLADCRTKVLAGAT